MTILTRPIPTEEKDNAIYGTAGVLDPSSKQQEQVALTQTPSPYISVMDMDWKHVRAVDLFAILSSLTHHPEQFVTYRFSQATLD